MDMLRLGLEDEADVGGFHVVESSKGSNGFEDDPGTELEIICRKIDAIDDPDDERLPELIKQRRTLEKSIYRERRLRQLKQDIERLLSDDFEHMSMMSY